MNKVIKLIILALIYTYVSCQDVNCPVYIGNGTPITCNQSFEVSPFTRVADRYYNFISTMKYNWFDAAHYCRTKGAHLASIETSAELKALSDYMLTQSYTDTFWLSGNDLALEGTFKWMGTGQPLSGLVPTDWGIGQPDNLGGNEDCLNVMLQGGQYLLTDSDCSLVNYFICEASLSAATSLTAWYGMFDGNYGYKTCLIN